MSDHHPIGHTANDTYREWIPVRERLPEIAGRYTTLVKPLLEDDSFEQVQLYTPMAHRQISGWQYARTTHWRSHRDSND